MLTEDYLIKMINLALAALLRVIGLKKNGDYLEALQLIDMTFEQLLGLRASMVKSLDDDRLYYLLTRDETLDTRRLVIIAALFLEEGDIYAAQNRAAESQESYARALRYYIEVVFNEAAQDDLELSQKIAYLVDALSLPGMGSDTLWPLAGYYEEIGAYSRAEAVLLNLVERLDIRSQIIPELAAFYERLQQISPAQLSAGGLTLPQVQAGLVRWQQ